MTLFTSTEPAIFSPIKPAQSYLRIDPAVTNSSFIAMTLMDATDHAASIWTPDEARLIAKKLLELADTVEARK